MVLRIDSLNLPVKWKWTYYFSVILATYVVTCTTDTSMINIKVLTEKSVLILLFNKKK